MRVEEDAGKVRNRCFKVETELGRAAGGNLPVATVARRWESRTCGLATAATGILSSAARLNTQKKTMAEQSKLTASTGSLMKEVYFPTPIYFEDLPDVEELNRAVRQHIYAWRDQDTEGIVRSNVARVGS